MCGSMVDIQSPTAEIRRGKKEEEEERRKQDENIMVATITKTPYHQAKYYITIIYTGQWHVVREDEKILVLSRNIGNHVTHVVQQARKSQPLPPR